jgi:hypothetical protein
MSQKNNENQSQSIEDEVLADLQKQPQIFLRLAENSLTVAESFRDNYLKNTAKFISALRSAMRQERDESILSVQSVGDVKWSDFSDEVVTFIDGGLGQVQLSGRIPILLRVGSYCVRTGETQLSEREQFGYYPVILGDLEGGSKERKDFPDIVRITAELLGGLAALERTPDLRVLMFHGPLVYLMSAYAGHTPFTENDIDIFLNHYAQTPDSANEIKESFLREAKLDIYPQMTDRAHEWSNQRVFEPMAWISFLYRRLIAEAKKRSPVPIICGAVERGELREFSQEILLKRVFRGLQEKGNEDYFNKMYGRDDLTAPKPFLDKLGYNDAILLSMLLTSGEASESWEIDKYSGLRSGNVGLPNESGTTSVNFSHLKPPNSFGFPKVSGCYVRVLETADPIRIETFSELGKNQINEAIKRVYLYSRLLPGYGFPVGLDIADKFAKIPAWMTNAYAKLIKLHLGISLQKGEISDKQMRDILIQSIYMTQRDWLFRPNS